MESVPESNPTTPVPPGYHEWQAPDGSVTVHMSLDVIDRMLADILTGFGAVPRRGAEVGGILIGSIDGKTVTIDDYAQAPCEYRRGPSYLLSESDQAEFAKMYAPWKPALGREKYAVGYFRSNTRDQPTVGEEDIALMRQYFAQPLNVMLMVRPYATKPSVAGFITWKESELSGGSDERISIPPSGSGRHGAGEAAARSQASANGTNCDPNGAPAGRSHAASGP